MKRTTTIACMLACTAAFVLDRAAEARAGGHLPRSVRRAYQLASPLPAALIERRAADRQLNQADLRRAAHYQRRARRLTNDGSGDLGTIKNNARGAYYSTGADNARDAYYSIGEALVLVRKVARRKASYLRAEAGHRRSIVENLESKMRYDGLPPRGPARTKVLQKHRAELLLLQRTEQRARILDAISSIRPD